MKTKLTRIGLRLGHYVINRKIQVLALAVV